MKLLSRPEELMLLAIWRLRDNAYCVPIRKQVSDVTGRNWSFGAVYVPLERLERRGYISSFLGEPTSERGGRRKRFYKLAKEGLTALIEIEKVEKAMWTDIPKLTPNGLS